MEEQKQQECTAQTQELLELGASTTKSSRGNIYTLTITLDRFHMQQLVTDAMQELRLKHKKEEQKAQNEQRKLFKEQLKEKYEKSLKRRKKNKFLPCSSSGPSGTT